MIEEASLGCRLRKIDKTKNYRLDELKHNDLISEKYKRTCKYLNYVEYFLILVSTVTGCVSISAFTSLVCVTVGITSSAFRIKFMKSLLELKKYKSIKKRRKSIIK